MHTTAILTTDWGICDWNEWEASGTFSTAGVDGIVPVSTPLLEIPHADLVYWMGKFVLEVQKDKSEYSPKSLYALLCCFKHFYEQNGVHDVNPLSAGDTKF